MSKRDLYIHIGTHKTGTTSIQKTMDTYRNELLSQNIHYPMAGRKLNTDVNNHLSKGHHGIPIELKQKEIGIIQQLLDEINSQNSPSIVISSEDFSELNHEEIQRLANKLQSFNAKVIIYLRRQDQYAQSRWAQHVKFGRVTETFNEWIEKLSSKSTAYGSNGEPLITLDYEKIVDGWAQIFGEDNILLSVYEKKQMPHGLLVHFFNHLNFDIRSLKIENQKANVTPGIKVLEFIRNFQIALNRANKNTKIPPRFYIELLKHADNLGWNNHKINMVTFQQYKRLMTKYNDSNQRLAKKYLNRKELFLDSFEELPLTTFSVENFSAEELFEIIPYTISEILLD